MIDFKAPYTRKDALSFISHFLPEDFKESIEENIRLNFKPQFIECVNKLGESEFLQSLHIFEVLHGSENDPRVGLSRDIFRLLANFGIRKALVFFISKKSPNYRFSLVTLDLKWEEGRKIEKEYSNPRRYSFFLGQDAKVHTPSSFLIVKGRVKDLADLISRFDVEIVTKEFFQKYKELFDGLCDSLNKDRVFSKLTARGEITVETFAKKLLGQIVFCYFLQKKGWLGAVKGERVVKGDKDFMRSLYERYKKEGKDYFNNGLEYLFYDSLNRTPEGDDYYRSYFKCQIPFLNGGLFEPLQDYDWKGEFLYISDNLFSNKKGTGILDVFDLYNFTVYEDDPIDREVSVDPEMLGKVFENLLPENIRKGQGAYYTPREIVHYMCRESLVNFLITNTKVAEVRIRELVHDKELSFDQRKGKAATWRKEMDELIPALKGIRVCDPACGSGAFLVGMLHEIVEIRRFLEEEENTYRIRKETIQNCIYGVDIDPGAVEIAKLRLWLSLVVDYHLDEIEPLPNLDYKIMCGNSLLEELIVGDEAIKLVDERMLATYRRKNKSDLLFSTDGLGVGGSTERRIYLLEARAEKRQYLLDLNAKNTLTREVRIKIEDEITAINKELEPKRTKVKSVDQHLNLFAEKADKYFETLKNLHKDYFNEFDPVRKKNKREQIEAIEMEFIKASVQERVDEADTQIRNLNMQNPDDRKRQAGLLQKKLDCIGVPEKIRRSHVRPYFLWELNFCDVFEVKGGFDVVIANPPYITVALGKKQKFFNEDQVEYFKKKYSEVFEYKGNTFSIFLMKSVLLLKEGGCLSFIIPNTLLLNSTFSKTRNFILNNCDIRYMINITGRVFENAEIGGNLILSLFRGNNKGNMIQTLEMSEPRSFNQDLPFISLNQDSFQDNDEFKFYIGTKDSSLIKKIYGGCVPLGDIVKFYQGVITGDNKKFLSNKKIDHRYQKILRGRDIGRYSYCFNDTYILFDTSKLWSNTNEEFFKAKEKLINRQTSDVLIAAYDNKGFFTLDSTHVQTLINKNFNLKFILALFNSQLLNYCYDQTVNEGGRTFAQVKTVVLKTLPIKNISKEGQEPFISLVDHILSITNLSDYSTDLSKQTEVLEIQYQIDQLVYKLYGLTPEEIKIIENFDKK